MFKPYLCIGAWVSNAAGEVEFIDPQTIPALYKVDPKECDFIVEGDFGRNLRDPWYKKMIWLRYRTDGNYEIPTLPKSKETEC